MAQPHHIRYARTYIGFDILRRILEDYFHYSVTVIRSSVDLQEVTTIATAIDNTETLENAAKQLQQNQTDTNQPGNAGIEPMNTCKINVSTTVSEGDDNADNDTTASQRHYLQQIEDGIDRDWHSLSVTPPTLVTRVADYLDEIIEWICELLVQKLAYKAKGSVYLSVQALEAIPDLHYCKIVPEQIRNAIRKEEEGKVAQCFLGDKRNPRDFALWKKAQGPGELQWDSPWGRGHPGWHTGCAVMATTVVQKFGCPSRMDIFSGNEESKFPHHDNVLAQAEAKCGERQWANYILHSGLLHIRDRNLVGALTIHDVLQVYSPRQIRMAFVLHRYNSPMVLGENTMHHAITTEKYFMEFFRNVEVFLRAIDEIDVGQPKQATLKLQEMLSISHTKVHAALSNDFDTPAAMHEIANLARATNVYMEEAMASGTVVNNSARFIRRILQVLGLVSYDVTGDRVGQLQDKTMEKLLDAMVVFRSSVRTKARSKDFTGVLQECDILRDEILPPLGIRLEDKASLSVWKLTEPKSSDRSILQVNSGKVSDKHRETPSFLQEYSVSPREFMRHLKLEDGQTYKFTQFDEAGLPTHDSEGKPLSKNQTKAAQKLFKLYQRKYEKHHQALINESNDFEELGD